MWFLLPCNLFCLKIATIIKSFTKTLDFIIFTCYILVTNKKEIINWRNLNDIVIQFF